MFTWKKSKNNLTDNSEAEKAEIDKYTPKFTANP